MVQEAAWKVLVRQEVQDAAGRCFRARGKIADVLRKLKAPVLKMDVAEFRAWVPRADATLADASGDLGAAASLMTAAGLIAFRAAAAAAAAGPLARLPRINDVPDEGLRAALEQLREASELIQEACDLVEVGRAYLCAARLMLEQPHLAGGLLGLINVKRISASDELEAAQEKEQSSTELVLQALQWLML